MKFPLYLIVAGLLCASPVFGQHSTIEDFNKIAKIFAGRWIVDITFITDWPGQGKKGDKATGYKDLKLSEDGHALVGKEYGGKASATLMLVYNAASKQIRESGVDSGGTTWIAIYTIHGENITIDSTGSLADGSKIEGKYKATISDGGNTIKWTGSTTINGKRVDDLQDVQHRVGK